MLMKRTGIMGMKVMVTKVHICKLLLKRGSRTFRYKLSGGTTFHLLMLQGKKRNNMMTIV